MAYVLTTYATFNMNKATKIVLFLDKQHKSFLIYDSMDDLKLKETPFKKRSEINNPPSINKIYQEWEIEKTEYSNNSIKIHFHLLPLNRSFGRMNLKEVDSNKKILLYLTLDKKCYIKYTTVDVFKSKFPPEHYEYNGILKNTKDVLEKWILKKVDERDKILILEFQLLFRKK